MPDRRFIHTHPGFGYRFQPQPAKDGVPTNPTPTHPTPAPGPRHDRHTTGCQRAGRRAGAFTRCSHRGGRGSRLGLAHRTGSGPKAQKPSSSNPARGDVVIKTNKVWAILSAAALALVVAACGSSSSSSGGATGSSTTLVGAGSTLVAPLISRVAARIRQIGEGRRHLRRDRQRRRDRADHRPHGRLRRQRRPAQRRPVQRSQGRRPDPLGAGGDGRSPTTSKGRPNELKLTGPLLAEIYEGKITTWNAPTIAALNPGVKLPSTKITPVHRSDGSGDTYALHQLPLADQPRMEVEDRQGDAKSRSRAGIGGKGNSGVGGAISSTNGSIGYIAIAYVLANKFDFALIQNAAGELPGAGHREHLGGRQDADVDAREQRSLDRRPAGLGDGCVPDLDLHLRARAAKSPKASTLKPFLKWAITDRPEVRAEARLRAAAGGGRQRPTRRRSKRSQASRPVCHAPAAEARSRSAGEVAGTASTHPDQRHTTHLPSLTCLAGNDSTDLTWPRRPTPRAGALSLSSAQRSAAIDSATRSCACSPGSRRSPRWR